MLQDACPAHDPAREVLYRDFCELLVRLAAVRFPQQATLEARLQTLLTQYLLPLLTQPAGLDNTPRSVAAAVAGAGAAGLASGGGAQAANQPPLQQQQALLRQSLSEDASKLLLDHWQLVEALFDRVSVKGLTGDVGRSAAEQLSCQQEEGRYKAQVEALLGPGCWASYDPLAAGAAAADAAPTSQNQDQQQQDAEADSSGSSSSSGGMFGAATTARRALEYWSAAGLVPGFMGPVELLQVLLEPFLASNDPEPPRWGDGGGEHTTCLAKHAVWHAVWQCNACVWGGGGKGEEGESRSHPHLCCIPSLRLHHSVCTHLCMACVCGSCSRRRLGERLRVEHGCGGSIQPTPSG